MKNPGELCKCGQMPLHCAHVTAPPQSDLPIAPGQEQFEDWFVFTLATCRVVNVARFEHWMRILRAEHHAEAWDGLEPYPHERGDNSVAWRRKAEELKP